MNTLLSILLSVVVSVQMDSTQMWIGQQTDMHVQATASAEEHVQLPVLDRQVIEDLLIVERSEVDTTKEKDGRISYRQDYKVTAFKDSLYYIAPLRFVVDGDTVLSNSLSLNVVQPFEIDTTEAITDIKPVMRPKIWWWGIIRWILLALAIIGLGVGIWWLWKKLKSREQEKVEEIDPELLRPCNEVALEKLDKIKEDKIWQTGLHKQYFTDLTDVVREYIGRRFSVSSTEKTSDETLQEMKPILAAEDQKELYTRLEKMLRLADLVKFAKWNPTPDENESALLSAYTFVKECGDVPEAAPAEEKEEGDNLL